MPDEQQQTIDTFKQGPDHWNQWKKQQVRAGHRPDLSDTDIPQLIRKDMGNLKGDLFDNSGYALLREYDFSHTELRKCNLEKCFLVNLSHANLTRADLTESALSDADLTDADLTGANLASITWDGARLNRKTNLSEIKLQQAKPDPMHDGPDRIQLSFVDRWVNWSRLRVIGKFPLFQVSWGAPQ